MPKLFYFILFLISSIPFLNAQKFPLRTIDFDDGLLKSSVFKITKDKQGYMWLSCDPAVIRFDGKNFVSYGPQQGVNGVFTFDIEFDQYDNMWIATYGNGIAEFDGTSFISFNTKNGFPADYIRKILFSSSGDLWAASFDSGIVHMKKGELPKPLHIQPGRQFFNAWDIIESKNGDIITASADGVYLFERSKNFIHRPIYTCDVQMTAVAEEVYGEFWAGGKQRLVHIKKDTVIDYSFVLPPEALIISLKIRKNDQSLFVSTNKGCIIIKNGKPSYLGQRNEFNTDFFWSIFIDENEEVWMGTYGAGVIKYDKRGIEIYQKDYIEDNTGVVCEIVEDTSGNIYFGTEMNGLYKKDGNKFNKMVDGELGKLKNVYGNYFDKKSNTLFIADGNGSIIWMNNDKITKQVWLPNEQKTGGLRPLNPNLLFVLSINGSYVLDIAKERFIPTGIPSSSFRAMYLDPDSTIWVTGGKGEVYTWKDYHVKRMDSKINPDKYVICEVLYDPFTQFYLFASTGGLIAWNGKKRYLFNSSNGLQSDMCQSMILDHSGRLWLGHEKGVTCIDQRTGSRFDLGYDQGFTTVNANSSSIFCDHDGNIWVGSGPALVKINPNEIIPTNKHTRLVIQSIYSSEKTFFKEGYFIHQPDEIRAFHNQNSFTVKFAALDYSNADDVKYRWKLKGLDKNFSSYSNTTEVNYTNLFPGEYEFVVEAIDSDGFATGATSFKFIVLKPFWEKIWFYILEILLFTMIVFLSFLFSSQSSENRLGEIMTVLTIIIAFESIIFYLSRYIDPLTNGIPIFQLAMNIILAVILQPFERWLKRKMKQFSKTLGKKVE